MPPPLEPLFTTRSTSPENRSVTLVSTPFPGSSVTVVASAAPASQHAAARTKNLVIACSSLKSVMCISYHITCTSCKR